MENHAKCQKCQADYYGGYEVHYGCGFCGGKIIREKIQKSAKLPKGLEGPAITLMITGLLAMAFTAFSGMIQIQ